MSEDISLPSATARLRLDGGALTMNWKNLDRLSGAASAGAAVKADAYGLGAKDVVSRLQTAGCRDFYVATWREAAEIEGLLGPESSLSVLNGVTELDLPYALQSRAKPVLNSLKQAQRWRASGQRCDIMINSGMNRLGINLAELGQVDWTRFDIDIVMSHLASADEDCAQNGDQLASYRLALDSVSGRRQSLANSAGIALGSDYHFDTTRPGLSLYGGIPRTELADTIGQVAFPEAQILQVRTLDPGDKLGYNALYVADHKHAVAIVSLGYADGYLRGFSNSGRFHFGEQYLPVLGRVSMDLIAVDLSAAPDLTEGDWVTADYFLPKAAEQSGLSQYELLTGLSSRYDRRWG